VYEGGGGAQERECDRRSDGLTDDERIAGGNLRVHSCAVGVELNAERDDATTTTAART